MRSRWFTGPAPAVSPAPGQAPTAGPARPWQWHHAAVAVGVAGGIVAGLLVHLQWRAAGEQQRWVRHAAAVQHAALTMQRHLWEWHAAVDTPASRMGLDGSAPAHRAAPAVLHGDLAQLMALTRETPAQQQRAAQLHRHLLGPPSDAAVTQALSTLDLMLDEERTVLAAREGRLGALSQRAWLLSVASAFIGFAGLALSVGAAARLRLLGERAAADARLAADRLADANRRLEGDVAARTAALRRANAALSLRADIDRLLSAHVAPLGASAAQWSQAERALLAAWAARVAAGGGTDVVVLRRPGQPDAVLWRRDAGPADAAAGRTGGPAAPCWAVRALGGHLHLVPAAGPADGAAVPGEPAAGVDDAVADLDATLAAWQLQRANEAARQDVMRIDAMLRTVVDHAPLAMLLMDAEQRYVLVNVQAAALHGLAPAAMLGRRADELPGLQTAPAMRPIVDAVFSRGEAVVGRVLDLPLHGAPGRCSHWIANCLPVRADDGTLLGAAALAVDVTELEQLRSQAQQHADQRGRQAERLAQISRGWLGTVERERQMLAHELHDDLNQRLAAVKIGLSVALSRLPQGSHRGLEAVMPLLDECIEQVRHRAAVLRPALLDERGLEAALRWHLDQQAARHQARIDLSVQLPGDGIAGDGAVHAYRVVQEAVQNALVHGAAREISVTLGVADGRLRIQVADDGHGFDPAARPADPTRVHLGLTHMRERAEALGGTLELTSAPGHGTVVRAGWPVRMEAVA